jgi:O-antigen/teichoic acid export membrane protein
MSSSILSVGFTDVSSLKRVFGELFLVALPKVVGGVATLVVNAALLRYFGPEQFAIYSLCITGILLSDAIIGAAMDLGVLRLAPLYLESDPDRARAIQKSALFLKIVPVGGLSMVLLLAFARPMSRFLFHQDGLSFLLFLSAFSAIGLLSLRSTQAYLQVQRRFGLYGTLDWLQNGLKFGGIGAILWLKLATVTSVLSFYGMAPMIAFGLGLLFFGTGILGRTKQLWSAAREMLRQVGWYATTFAVTASVGRLDVFLLTSWSSLSEVGIFAGGQVFALIPELVGGYLAVVLGPRVVPYCREGKFASFFRRFQFVMMVGCALLYVAAFFTLKFVGPILLPAAFKRSGSVLLILLAGALASMAAFPLTYTFLLFVRPRFLFKMDLFALPLLLILYYYVIPQYGAVGAAWVTSGSRLIKAGIAQGVAWKSARDADTIL